MGFLFSTYEGGLIPDIISYVKEYISERPGVTVSVGCDSTQKRRKTTFACTVMFHNKDIRNGAHVVFYRDSTPKIKDHFDRLYRESEYALTLAEHLDAGLCDWERSDIDIFERKRYVYHTLLSDGKAPVVMDHERENYISRMHLDDSESNRVFRKVDIHLDYNPSEFSLMQGRLRPNRSYPVYRAFVPGIRGMGYRTWVKPLAYGATSAADLLVKK
jgi:predicted RNase H-related nuclease YkuK (DUF458 family)